MSAKHLPRCVECGREFVPSELVDELDPLCDECTNGFVDEELLEDNPNNQNDDDDE